MHVHIHVAHYPIIGRCTASTYIFEIGTGRVKAKKGGPTGTFKLRYHQLHDLIMLH